MEYQRFQLQVRRFFTHTYIVYEDVMAISCRMTRRIKSTISSDDNLTSCKKNVWIVKKNDLWGYIRLYCQWVKMGTSCWLWVNAEFFQHVNHTEGVCSVVWESSWLLSSCMLQKLTMNNVRIQWHTSLNHIIQHLSLLVDVHSFNRWYNVLWLKAVVGFSRNMSYTKIWHELFCHLVCWSTETEHT